MEPELRVCDRAKGRHMKSILLVEDSKFFRLASQRALARAGYAIVSADDGEQALRQAQAHRPDLIILDMMLPKLGGPDVLRALKNNPITARIPVLVLSGLSEQNETRLKNDGAAAYIEKSRLRLDTDAETLIEIVRNTLES
jgi:CheY-like chemotaxis protein